MNYPLWEIPAPGLLVAFIAIVHVFISHFAVGGGLFLVLAERKARRENDPALLAYVERHSRFFALLTLVAGALTGVGIWFTIGLVHPSATASLIASFVWGWAIEWTFFITEITAALVYAYGWRRLPPATHLRIGWIYFGAAWLSLAVINGILSFMLTPGDWITTRGFWDGVLNPTYLPSLVARTAGAVGLAGIYALMTATWMTDGGLKARVARWASVRWVGPAAIVLPLSVLWYLAAADTAGVPVAEAFGAKSASMAAIVQAAFAGPVTGQPIAQRALIALVIASALLVLVTIVIARWRQASYGRASVALAMSCAFVVLGASEFIREDLRKPFVIGGYMFVTGVRMPPPPGVPMMPEAAHVSDRFTVDALAEHGVLESARWSRPVPATGDVTTDAIARGREVFRLSCSTCHTMNGYLAIRRQVAGMTVAGASGLIGRLGAWRGRMMPPFAGNAEERHALAVYLASVGGMTPQAIAQAATHAAAGARLFEENCSACHAPDADFPFNGKGRRADEFYALLGRLPQVNDAMPAFEGSDEDRRSLSEYLTTIEDPSQGGRR